MQVDGLTFRQISRQLRVCHASILHWVKRHGDEFQDVLFESVQDHDDDNVYRTVLYSPAFHYPMKEKSQTYSVEGAKANLGHYLARFQHETRCSSRCEVTLRKSVKLFAYHRRQLFKQRLSNYTHHLWILPHHAIDKACLASMAQARLEQSIN